MTPSTEHDLGPDLSALVAELPARVIAIRHITGLPVRGLSRATFRLTCADGTIYKGRRMDSETDARRVFELTRTLDADGIPRPLAHHRAALVEPWIKGRAVRRDESVHVFRRVGSVLGSIHAIEHDLGSESARWTPMSRLSAIERRLGELVDLRVVPGRTARRLEEIAARTAPPSFATGIIHRDVWPRNVVIARDGTAWIIDSGNVSVGAHAFDRARTEYLWPMEPAQRAAFEAGYAATARTGDTLQDTATSTFWSIDVLSEVALFRRVHGARGIARPVTLLQRLARP